MDGVRDVSGDSDRHTSPAPAVVSALHDVGKLGIPTDIIRKAGPLTADEWAVMREHSAIGERILRGVPDLAGVARAVRHGHERWDGLGYPDH